MRPETMQVRRDLGIFTHDGFPWDVFGIFTYMKTIQNQPFIVGKYTFRPMDHIFFLQGGRPEQVVNGVTGYYKPFKIFKWPDKWVSEVISPSKWPKRLVNGGDPTYLLTSD